MVTYAVDPDKCAEYLESIWLPPLPMKWALLITAILLVPPIGLGGVIAWSITGLLILILWLIKWVSHSRPINASDIGKHRYAPLSFDSEGLDCADMDRQFRYLWTELSSFRISQGTIRFNVPDDGRFPRILRWGCRRQSKAPGGWIPDIYEEPLEEVAATLNLYRDRALDAKRSTD